MPRKNMTKLALWLAIFSIWIWSSAETGCSQDESQFQGTRAEAFDAFLNSELPKEKRILAGSVLRFPTPEESARLMTIVTDPEADEDLRRLAIQAHGPNFAIIPPCLRILENPEDGSAQFNSWLVDHVNNAFRFPLQSRTRQEVVSVYRKLLEDPRPEISLAAFEALLAVNDDVALKLVKEGFEDESKAKLQAAQAIQLLYRADPRQHIPLIRPLLSHADESVRAEAVKALGFDPESRAKIVSLLTDDGASSDSLQIAALEALAIGGALEFSNNALRIVRDQDKKAEVRAEAMRWMGVFVKGGREQVTPEQQVDFARACEAVAAETDAPEALRNTAVQLNRSSRQFEAVRQYYQESEDGERKSSSNEGALLDEVNDTELSVNERKLALRSLVKQVAARKLTDTQQVELAKAVDKLAADAPKELKAYAQRIHPWLRKQSAVVRKFDQDSKKND